ncbi:hypothetical protein SAMN05421810_102331 [Amycolatopsis arida]|uniref:Uncharacterized protein n=1 Tax=Amycolatopsis arida TaxID=587909 RepID=A0A1I5PLU2_9PSEU|nr:hypothetical protein [Amycolatopsis arida]TDX98539.1 hypothetical protein CLV69_101331 [Amycolatopsis arida]SFP35005.1 hypothetical protein SAMN05421810_102331 [Amycolatopsis arida]
MTASGAVRFALLALLVLDAVLLSTLELLYLPLRLDGLILPRLGDVPFPVTVVLAALTTPLLVTSAARLVHPRAAIVPLAVWVVTVLSVGLLGPGGDLVLLADWRTLLLLAGGVLPAAVALGGTLGRARARTAGGGHGR